MEGFRFLLICFLCFVDLSVQAKPQDLKKALKSSRRGLGSSLGKGIANAFINNYRECEITVPKDFANKYEPLILQERSTGGYTTVLPDENGKIVKKYDEELMISCSGTSFSTSSIQSSKFKCAKQNKWKRTLWGDKSFKNLYCKAPVLGTLQFANVKCAGGNIVRLGFQAMGEFIKIFHACHHMSTGDTRYVSYKIHGALLKYQRLTPKPAYFKRGSSLFYLGIDTKKAYTRENVIKVLKKNIGPAKAMDYISDCPSNCIEPRQLAPREDFLFGTRQNLTYFFVNTVPMWSTISQGNWASLEKDIRKYAIEQKKNLNVEAGVWDALKLPDQQSGKKTYLVDKAKPSLMVPAFVWKMIKHEPSKSCMGFVVFNNPFEQGNKPKVCDDVCIKYGWTNYKGNRTNGEIYCCEGSQMTSFIGRGKNFSDDCKHPLRR